MSDVKKAHERVLGWQEDEHGLVDTQFAFDVADLIAAVREECAQVAEQGDLGDGFVGQILQTAPAMLARDAIAAAIRGAK